MKVNEALADALAQEAEGPIFGLMGDANMPVWGALCKDERVRMVWSRHDGAAVLMADGFAQATGRLAVATVTCGPGLANAANAILTASRASTPMVIFTGEYVADGGKSNLQALDQRRFAAACEAEFRPLARLDALADDIAEGFYTARTRKCPVILNMPQALWEAELKWDWDYRPSRTFVPRTDLPAAGELIESAAQKLRQAQRPVIVAGRGAVFADARAELEQLGDQIGALLATSLVGKGFFDGHPYDVGIAGSFSSATTEGLMAQADLVIAFGASLNFFTTEGGMLFPSAEVIRVDTRAHPAAIGFTPGMHLQGDAKATAAALVRSLQSSATRNEGFRQSATRDALAAPVPQPARAADGLDPRELMRVLSRALPRDTQVVSGAGHFWSWPIAHLALPPGGRFQHTAAFGSIGLGLPHGIGAAAGNPGRKTLVIEGDGSLLQAIQELHAAAEQRIPFVLLVMNDSGYGAEVMKMTWKKRDPRDAQWTSPDYVAIARGFGADGVRIGSEAELAGALERGFASDRPFVIDAPISPTLVSDSYSRLFLGQPNQIPLLRPARQE
ncbi:thiamine pyrophosphate-binding protein [Variovorax sp. KK3]|uniref:thiamine pyrophosphate-binding protein n=1 Tax=Variovorax sp. KK3 TaxID=1855728 RepID=UPI00097C4BE6|nr:thiamine pyrophosphate-binding protein [Variovorax sp. KK3]